MTNFYLEMWQKKYILKLLLYRLWKDYKYCKKHNRYWNSYLTTLPRNYLFGNYRQKKRCEE